MTAQTPGHAAYEAFMEANGLTAYPPDEYWEANESRGWEAAAQAAIDAFLDGDSVSAESIREALAAHEQPQPPKLAANPQDLAEQWLAAAYEPDDSQTGISYGRDDMIRAFGAGHDEARALYAARGPQAAPGREPEAGT